MGEGGEAATKRLGTSNGEQSVSGGGGREWERWRGGRVGEYVARGWTNVVLFLAEGFHR